MKLKALALIGVALSFTAPAFAQSSMLSPTLTLVGDPNTSSSQEIIVPPSGTAAPTASPFPAEGVTTRHVSQRLRIGPEIGLFAPTKNLVTSRFGKNWLSFGIGLGQYELAPVQGHWNFDISLLSNASGSNGAYLLPLGAEYRVGLSSSQTTVPYLGCEVDYALTDIRSTTDNVKWGIRTGGSAALLAGIDFASNARIEGGYRWFTTIAGYDFSGAFINAGYRF